MDDVHNPVSDGTMLGKPTGWCGKHRRHSRKMTYFYAGSSTSILVFRRVNCRFWLNQTMGSSRKCRILVPFGSPQNCWDSWRFIFFIPSSPQKTGTATSSEPRNAGYAKGLGTLHHLPAVQHILRIQDRLLRWQHKGLGEHGGFHKLGYPK